jgi:hypothetical protein
VTHFCQHSINFCKRSWKPFFITFSSGLVTFTVTFSAFMNIFNHENCGYVKKSNTLISQQESFMFLLYVQELAFLEPSVDKGNTCSNLCEEHHELFQLIFLLLLISPEYSFLSHFTQHCTNCTCFCHLSKLMVQIIIDIHTAITKTFMSFVSLIFFIVTLPCACCSVANIFKCCHL